MCDFFFFGYFLWLLLNVREVRKWLPLNIVLMWILVVCALFSLSNSINPYYGLFTIHKMIRGAVLYWITVNILKSKDDFTTVINALAFSVIFQGVIVFYAKYIVKTVVVRSVGTFPHPNSLAMYLNLILPTLLCMILVSKSKKQTLYYSFALVLGMIAIVFTKSRGGLIIMLGGLFMAAGISTMLKVSFQKLRILFLGLVVVSILGSLAAPKIIQRFQKAPKESAETRHYFNSAARAMADDYFWGIGINSYSYSLANTEYYWYVYPDVEDDDREAFRDPDNARAVSRLGNCHHIYLLWASECGWISMYIFILLIALFMLVNSYLILYTRKMPFYNAIVIGLLCGFTTLHLQGFLEWVYRQTQVYYLFHFLSGVVVSIFVQRKNLQLNNKNIIIETKSLEISSESPSLKRKFFEGRMIRKESNIE
ncbi:O-antigen ligase family protein [Candidatus Uabimicrobium sp. HlEnr_7]|uniref:O-antigen ligase family protein n=1 Tax=Candidatus Uabimicrobium helgolandensis TaxID=3095367 RepID=UPI0035565463